MNPTLREPELMEVMPYGDSPLRVGDVAFFLAPKAEQPVVHRIVRIAPEGISTRGDNNATADAFRVQARDVQGRVVAAWRGQKRRRIAGGLRGRLTSHWFRWRRLLDRALSPVLHPIYHALSKGGVLARLLPAHIRPRVVGFRVQGRDQLLLLLGTRTVGRYDDHTQHWRIQRPFHLLVDARALPGRQYKVRVNKPMRTDRRGGDPRVKPGVRHELVLADGTHWTLGARDAEAAAIVDQLGNAMRLSPVPAADAPTPRGLPCRLWVEVNPHSTVADCYVPLASERDGDVVCILSPCAHWGGPFVNLTRLSLIIAREAQARGGLLIHGALAERDGGGVILAAPGGTGKTTASNRLAAPWRSRCDDTTLVVRDGQGIYWAHPWPTWSRFLNGGTGGAWEVRRAIPLQAIFILHQALDDRAERVGPGRAIGLLMECAGQATQFMPLGLSKEAIRLLHAERFDNLTALTRQTPVAVLHFNRTGTFWREIERTLADCSGAKAGPSTGGRHGRMRRPDAAHAAP